MNVWKALGLAGVAGVAAAGVIIAREQRQRTQLSPEEIRDRLHGRLKDVPTAATGGSGAEAPVGSRTRPRWLPRQFRRRSATAR